MCVLEYGFNLLKAPRAKKVHSPTTLKIAIHFMTLVELMYTAYLQPNCEIALNQSMQYTKK